MHIRIPLLAGTVTVVLAGLTLLPHPAIAQTAPVLPWADALTGAPAAPGTSPAAAAANRAALPATYFVPSLTTLATGTSNATFGAGIHRSDAVFDIVPRLVVHSNHRHVHLNGDILVDGALYARGSLKNRALPSGSLDLDSELINRFLFFDAGVLAQQNIINPYAGRLSTGAGANQYTTIQYRASPYIDRLFTPTLHLYIRSDNTWTQVTGNPTNIGIFGGRYGEQSFRLEQKPVPLGYTLLAQYTDSRFNHQAYSSLRDAAARGIINVQLGRHLQLGGIGGYEHVRVFLADVKRPIYGGRGLLQFGRTGRLEATVERRYFGTGWDVLATQSAGALSFTAHWTRAPTTFLGSQFNGTPGTNLGGLLTGALAPQFPDPAIRAVAVQQLLDAAGLPSTLLTTNNLYTQIANLGTSVTFTALLLRERNSYAISVYHSRTEDLFLPGQRLLQVVQTLSNDSIQTGAALNYTHLLTPITKLSLEAIFAKNDGFGINRLQNSRQGTLIIQLEHGLSPFTSLLIGARGQILKSSVVANAYEGAVFVGLAHRF